MLRLFLILSGLLLSQRYVVASEWSDSKIKALSTSSQARSEPLIKIDRIEGDYVLQPDEVYLSNIITTVPIQSQTNNFDCVGSVFAVIKFLPSNHGIRNALLTYEWINPHQEVVSITQQSYYKEQGGMSFRWMGLSFSRGKGAGLFSLFDSSAGTENFIGNWQVNIKLGDKKLMPLMFTVDC